MAPKMAVFMAGSCKTVREAVEQFNAGRLFTIYASTTPDPAEPILTR
jgi:hypothetical protein